MSDSATLSSLLHNHQLQPFGRTGYEEETSIVVGHLISLLLPLTSIQVMLGPHLHYCTVSAISIILV